MKVFVEAGAKRVFAGAIDWPGWARSGKTEVEALQALLRYGSRYRASLGRAVVELEPPTNVEELDVVARLKGGSGTDFGVPSEVAKFDRSTVDDTDLKRLVDCLRASWRAFEKAAAKAEGKTLGPAGPRGGGRALDKIREHVREADEAYIAMLGARPPRHADWAELQAAFIEALSAKIRGELPNKGPRGGERWPARYAIRRSAWHALDHAWEIEDRAPG